jgi:hypothetical protein
LTSYAERCLNTPTDGTPPPAVTTAPPNSGVRPQPNVTRTFTVKSAYKTATGLVLLNDSEDFRDPATLQVAADSKRVAGIPDDVQTLIGRTVTVTGYTTQYKGRPQIGAKTFTLK